MPSSLKNDLEDDRTSLIFYRQFTVIVKCHWKIKFILAFVTHAIHLFTRQLVKTISVGKNKLYFALCKHFCLIWKISKCNFFLICQKCSRPSMLRIYWCRNYVWKDIFWSKRLHSDWKGSRINHGLELHRQRTFYWCRRSVFIWSVRILSWQHPSCVFCSRWDFDNMWNFGKYYDHLYIDK